MITMDRAGFERAMFEVEGVKKRREPCKFSPRKHYLAYRLAKMNRNQRGYAIERMVRHHFEKQGKSVIPFGKNHTFDLMVDGFRVEVKSALAVMKNGKMHFQFGHICLDHFSKIVLVAIAPNGIKVKIMSRTKIAKLLQGSRTKYKILHVPAHKF